MAAPDRGKLGIDRLDARIFQRAITRRRSNDLRRRIAGNCREELGKVGEARLGHQVIAQLTVAVGDRSADFAPDDVRAVEHPYHAWRVVRRRLAHLPLRVRQVTHPSSDSGGHEFGNRERRAVDGVEPTSEVTRQFDVLGLVAADRDAFRVVEQDVRGHEARIGEQRRSRAGLAALLLELDHPAELADVRGAFEQVAELHMGGNVRLHEHGRPFRIEPGRQEQRGRGYGQPAQPVRFVLRGECVQVGHEIEPVVLVVAKAAQGAEIVAQRQRTGRGDARYLSRARAGRFD